MSENLGLVFEPTAPALAALVPALAGFSRIDLQEVVSWGDQIVVFDGDRHVYVQPYPAAEMAAEHAFDDWTAPLVPVAASGLVVADSDIDLAKRVAQVLARHFRFWVETNQGIGDVYTSEAFVRRGQREPVWEWRHRPDDAVPVAPSPSGLRSPSFP